MASKSQCRDMVKDRNPKQSVKPRQNELPDEITLRDEIFQLKRQIMLLKKANERNVIKVRKYEDEARRKDRQIEQLMDPVKNGDVRKLLSTKGAALLLNLKEQNNTLIQMILDKDAQIRKLLSEIKTSKLYANTGRAELYKNEVERLRNLLIKSQAAMKEAQEVPQRRSICVGGTPALEMTPSSDRSSPRDLEELHFTIESLEMHMKYSNELLARKNEQIIRLTDQINARQCSSCRKVIQNIIDSRLNETDYRQRGEIGERGVSSLSGVTQATDGNTYEIISPKSTVLFDKNISIQQKGPHDKKRLPNSAPAGPVRDIENFADSPRRDTGARAEILQKDDGGSEEDGKIRFRLSKPKTKLDRFFVRDNMNYAENLRSGRRDSGSSFTTTDESDMETAEFELMEKKIENDQIEVKSPVKLKPQTITERDGHSESSGLGESPLDPKENPTEGARNVISDPTEGAINGGETQESLTTSEKDTVLTDYESEIEVFQNGEGIREKTFVIDRVYRRDFSDPYDSESSEESMHEVEVEAEINHNGGVDDNAGSDHTDDLIVKDTCEDEDNDDDDVVVC